MDQLNQNRGRLFSQKLTRAASQGGAVVLLALTYFIAGQISLRLAIPPGYVTAIWVPAGIALAALLIYGWRLWPGVVLGSFLINVGAGPETAMSAPALVIAAAIAIGAGLQALAGTFLVRRFLRRDPGLLELRNILALMLLGGPISCLINSTWGSSTLLAGGLIDHADYALSWMTWWVGDSIGVLTALPLCLIWLGKPRKAWAKRRLLASLPIMVFLCIAVIAFLVAREQEEKNLKLRFAQDAEVIGNSLDKQISSSLEAVHAIQSYVESANEISRDQFRTFVKRNLDRLPGVHALSWNPRIRTGERASYEEAARQDGLRDYQITERDAAGHLIPAAQRPEYIAVYYIEPYATNKSALGYDVYSQPTRKTALDLARDTGQPFMTTSITLVQETGNQKGVLLFVPIYQGGLVPENVADRRARLRGYAVGVFRMGDVLAAALHGLGMSDLEAKLYDDSAEGESSLLAAYRLDRQGGLQRLAQAEVPAISEGALGDSRHFHVAGREWRLVLAPDSHYLAAPRSWSSWGVLVGGLSFTGMLGIFLLAMTGRSILDKRRADELAKANTSLTDEVEHRARTEQALYAEKERAEITLHSIGDAVITTDAQGLVEYLNPTAERLTEWTTAGARGRPIAQVFPIIHEETREPVTNPVQRCRDEGQVVALANHTVMISRSGREYAVQDSAAPIRDREGHLLGVVLVFNDVTEARRMARQAAHDATHDTLTGLVNRREFDRRLEHALASSKRYGGRHAVCYLDLDQFKIVNDTCGHRAGDELLKHVASLLAHGIRERDTLARLGGDEFGLLLDNCPPEKAVEIAETLVASARNYRFVWDERPFDIGASIGLVQIDGQTETAETLLSHADIACYAAKNLGRNRVHVYEPDDTGTDPSHADILRVADMRSAIEQNRFQLYSQPIWTLSRTEPQVLHHELLLRMIDENNGLVLPGCFVPAAERFGIMDQVDRWVIRTAFRDYHRLLPDESEPRIAINLSGNLLGDKNLLTFLHEQFDLHEVNPEKVCFEITETAAIRNISAATQLVRDLREIGCQFALDDFGSGLSSFAYLKSLPVNYLKIDGSLVRRIADDADDRAMVEAINRLAHQMGVETIAEYAETLECVQVLRELGVDYVQGYALARPGPLAQFDREMLPSHS